MDKNKIKTVQQHITLRKVMSSSKGFFQKQ